MYLRRFSYIVSIFFFIFSLIVPFSPVHAESSEVIDSLDKLDEALSGDNTLDKSLKEFCEKRSGNQMNLETWYSGKCTDDTFSGEGVGFSDIVILDLAEKISGKKDPNKTFSKTLFELFQEIEKNESQAYSTPEEKQLADYNTRQKYYGSQDNGLIGQTSKLIGMLFQYQPASTQSYLAHVNQNLFQHKIIPDALAAPANGTGFSAFSPFLPIWTVTRNLAYFILVIFFVVYGFMMMFRVNLGQKTAITVQLALPKLIITLLIITFSYAIIGLVFDIMYVVIYFIINYLDAQNIINRGILWSPSMTASGNTNLGLFGSLVVNTIVSLPATFFGVINLLFGGGLVGTIAGVVTGIIGAFTGIGLIITLVLNIAILIAYGKLFLKLIGSFINIVISLITGPLVLLGNALPGSTAIGNWFRNIVGNVAVFPATMILLMFSYVLMVQPLVGICTDVGGWFGMETTDTALNGCEKFFGVNSLVEKGASVTNIPLITPSGGFSGRDLLALLGVGLLLMAAKYVDMIREAFKVSPFKYGTAITEALTEGQGVVSSAQKSISDYSSKKPVNIPPPSGGATQSAPTQPAPTQSAPVAPPAAPQPSQEEAWLRSQAPEGGESGE